MWVGAQVGAAEDSEEVLRGFPSGSAGKESACNAGDTGKAGSIPGSGRSLGSVFIPIPEKGNAKECANYHTIALISHASKVMVKILLIPASTVHEP